MARNRLPGRSFPSAVTISIDRAGAEESPLCSPPPGDSREGMRGAPCGKRRGSSRSAIAAPGFFGRLTVHSIGIDGPPRQARGDGKVAGKPGAALLGRDDRWHRAAGLDQIVGRSDQTAKRTSLRLIRPESGPSADRPILEPEPGSCPFATVSAGIGKGVEHNETASFGSKHLYMIWKEFSKPGASPALSGAIEKERPVLHAPGHGLDASIALNSTHREPHAPGPHFGGPACRSRCDRIEDGGDLGQSSATGIEVCHRTVAVGISLKRAYPAASGKISASHSLLVW